MQALARLRGFRGQRFEPHGRVREVAQSGGPANQVRFPDEIIYSVQISDYIYSQPWAGERVGRIHTIGKVVIWMYANDHLPPHFHIVSPDTEALIEIETFDLYAGEIPRGASARKLMVWARENVDQLRAAWNALNP